MRFVSRGRWLSYIPFRFACGERFGAPAGTGDMVSAQPRSVRDAFGPCRPASESRDLLWNVERRRSMPVMEDSLHYGDLAGVVGKPS
jgi:hypothetical protein